jgi:hypothetical protein
MSWQSEPPPSFQLGSLSQDSYSNQTIKQTKTPRSARKMNDELPPDSRSQRSKTATGQLFHTSKPIQKHYNSPNHNSVASTRCRPTAVRE